MISGYFVHTLITIGYYAILAVSLNLSMGYTGLINLGHVAFFGIGAYTTAILTKADVPFIFAFILAGVVAGLAGYLVTILTKRAKGDYFALITLGLAFVVGNVLINWRSLTRGPLGIPGIEKPNIFDWFVNSNIGYLIFTAFVALILIYFADRLMKSRYGRLLEAVRDDSIGLVVLGKNVFKLKYQIMMVSAGMAGIAGAIFAHYITYIHPSNFFISDIVLMLSIVIVGGLATVRGSVFATFLIIFLTESIRFIDLPSSIVGPSRLMIYSILLIAVLVYRPRGLFGKVDLE